MPPGSMQSCLCSLHYLWIFLQCRYFLWRFPKQSPRYYGKRRAEPEADSTSSRRKPEWVRTAVLSLAIELDSGCRMIADTFNRLYAHTDQSVGKTFVHELLRAHREAAKLDRKALKRRQHRPGPKNRTWGLDLTGKTNEAGDTQMILGILDHGTRANLTLTALPNKATITILRKLLDAVERFGKPRFVRTDNESIFQSRLFKFSLAFLGIRHQSIDKHSPWQNGRIERFFGTLKEKLDQWAVPERDSLNISLAYFQSWYNHIRPHQHLQGKTPAEAWAGVDVFRNPRRKADWFEAWDGLLTGYYFRE